MTDNHSIRHPKLDNLENQLGNALGVALAVIRDPALLDNRTMADLEKPLKNGATRCMLN